MTKSSARKRVQLSAVGLLVTSAWLGLAQAADEAPRQGLGGAQFERELASLDARRAAAWVIHSGNNTDLPFVILDKKEAKVFVFHADGKLRGATPALIGLAVGDDSTPGIGEKKLSAIRPEERTTPAGRFVASLDRNIKGSQILWVDYNTAISLHPVITSNTKERRAERLASPSPQDNRVSYGCINVAADFFKSVIIPAFTGTDGIVYVLPETRTTQQVFASYDVDSLPQSSGASPALTMQSGSVTSGN